MMESLGGVTIESVHSIRRQEKKILLLLNLSVITSTLLNYQDFLVSKMSLEVFERSMDSYRVDTFRMLSLKQEVTHGAECNFVFCFFLVRLYYHKWKLVGRNLKPTRPFLDFTHWRVKKRPRWPLSISQLEHGSPLRQGTDGTSPPFTKDVKMSSIEQ